MDFKYFKGPNADMSDLLDNKTNCSICGKIDYCFELDFAITKEFDQEEKEGKLGCDVGNITNAIIVVTIIMSVANLKLALMKLSLN